MKKFYIFLLIFFSGFALSQPYSYLLQNADWTIMKINWYGTDYYPPEPFKESGKVIFNGANMPFESRFFNYIMGGVTFGPNNVNYFQLQNLFRSYADIWDPGLEQVRQFDEKVISFYYPSQSSDLFYFVYGEASSGKTLVVTNPACHKLYYSNLLLSSSGSVLNKSITMYRNPAKDAFFVNSSRKKTEILNVEIFDA